MTICSDGGGKDGKGSIGIVMSIKDRIVIQLANRVPVGYDEISSYRSESYGILLSIKIIQLSLLYMTQHNIQLKQQQIKLICDNEAIVNTVNKFRCSRMSLKQHFGPDADTIRAIIIGLKSIERECKIEIHHIDGHQDKHNNSLTKEAALNVKADSLATIGLSKKNVKPVNLPGNKAYLEINNLQVTSKQSKALRDSFHASRMHEYFKDTYGWKDKIVDTIWWQAHGKALSQFSCGQKTTLQKYIHRRIACNKREHRYAPHRSPMCQLCKTTIECTDHIIQCKGCQPRVKGRQEYLKILQNKMIMMGTNSTTIRVIIAHLRAWLEQSEIPEMHEIAPEASEFLKTTVIIQGQIGWDQWMRGRIAIQWGEMYNDDMKHLPFPVYRPSASRWGKQIITETWKFVLLSWTIRNNVEHDNEGEPLKRRKEKLVEQIMWIKSHIKEDKEYPLKNIKKEDIMSMPIENIAAMAEQIKIEWKNP
jgi:ribonuclease HI